ncbi:MAG TPA: hypothetical protein VN495_02870, partial [Candidatus Paceibacterota bacterium]|nr:hypothetical protein [Candidatus Paceibacterota bacterium]
LARESEKNRYQFGAISAFFAQHGGAPLPLDSAHTLETDDFYLEIDFPAQESSIEKLAASLRELSEFVEQYPRIRWLVGQSWLVSQQGGELIKRYGFTKSDIPVPPEEVERSKEAGRSRPNASPRYIQRVESSQPAFCFADRDEFLEAMQRMHHKE